MTLERQVDTMSHAEPLRYGYAYIRVSTHDQEELSPDSQERLIREYARAHNIILLHIFIDSGISGRKADKRPQFKEMIAKAKSKEHPVDVIIVWRFSRFARNQEESIVYKSLLKKVNVDVVSLSEPLIDGPFGKLIERIIEWMDEYYSIRLSEEVKRGMTENAHRGKYQTVAPFGYRNGDDLLEIIPEEAEYVRMIFHKFYYEHMGFSPIAAWLNKMGVKSHRGGVWENRTVKYVLQNPAYKGYVRWNVGKDNLRKGASVSSPDMICVKGDHTAIIDADFFDQVQEEIARRYRLPKSRPAASYGHWLGNLLKCSCCGSSLTFQRANNGFQCISYGKGKCPESHFVRANLIEQAIIETLETRIYSGTIEYIEEKVAPAQFSDDYEILKEAYSKLENKEKRIKAAYQDGIDTLEEYKQNKELLQKEKERIQLQLEEIESKNATNDSIDHTEEMILRVRNIVDIIKSDASKEVKSDAIRSICDKIVYDKKAGNLDIYCVFRQL